MKEMKVFSAICLGIAVSLTGFVSYQYSLGHSLYEKDDYSGAKPHLDSALAVWPYHEAALTDRAYTNNCLYSYAEAISDADRVIALNPNVSSAYADKAWALNCSDRFEEGYAAATRALALDSGNGEAHASKAEACRGLYRLDEALMADNEHCRIHNWEKQAFLDRATTFELMNNPKAAEQDRLHAESLKD